MEMLGSKPRRKVNGVEEGVEVMEATVGRVEARVTRSATISTVSQGVSSPKTTVTSSTPARSAGREAMGDTNAPKTEELAYGMRPRYLRHNVWDPDSEFSRTTADWTETARPLPRPPLEELQDEVTAKTIRENPDLFKIVTPINVDIFESYLSDHPNQPFVRSVCQGLREGFWPWADTLKVGYPETLDESKPPPSEDAKRVFLRQQLAIEQSKDRFSRSFGTRLLPGMYCMPIHAVPKPNSMDM